MELREQTRQSDLLGRWEARIVLRSIIYGLDCASGPWADRVSRLSTDLLATVAGGRESSHWQRELALAGEHLALATSLRRVLGECPTPREALRRRVCRDLDHARRTDESLAESLASGRAVLLDCFDAEGLRLFAALRVATPLIAATYRERQVGVLAARGCSNDEIAFDLGCGASTVGTHMSRALTQLGLSHRSDLAFVDRPALVIPLGELELLVVPTHLRAPAALSTAEVQVAQLAVRGRSDRAIAASRGSSPRTVANQLRSVYRKLQVASRTELALALRASMTPAHGITRAAS